MLISIVYLLYYHRVMIYTMYHFYVTCRFIAWLTYYPRAGARILYFG